MLCHLAVRRPRASRTWRRLATVALSSSVLLLPTAPGAFAADDCVPSDTVTCPATEPAAEPVTVPAPEPAPVPPAEPAPEPAAQPAPAEAPAPPSDAAPARTAAARPASATTSAVSHFMWTPNSATTATILGEDGTGGTTLTIPDIVSNGSQDYTVTAISTSAFQGRGLTSVVLPPHLRSIAFNAFKTNLLTSIDLPDGLEYVGESAFYGNLLTSVDVPDSVTGIAFSAFGWNRLTSVTLPDTLTSLSALAFHANQLTSIDLPSSLTSIGENAFTGNALTDVTLPPGVTTVLSGAFSDNPLQTVHPAGTGPTNVAAKGPNGAFGTGAGLQIVPACEHAAAYGTTWHGYDVAATRTVTYDLGGHGSPVPAATPVCNTAAEAPADPTDPDWQFTGWFDDADLTSEHDFDSPVTSDITVHAGWVAFVAPVLDGPGAATFTVGQGASWSPDTLDGSPTPTVTADALPGGLTIDPATGDISGAPTTAGTSVVTLTAHNGHGTDATLRLTITVRTGITSFTVTTDKGTYAAGDPITITGGGLPADTVVELVLHSDPVTLGSVTTQADGTFGLTTRVPAGIAAGRHDIVATAVVDDADLTSTSSIMVTAAATSGDDDPEPLGSDRRLPAGGTDLTPGVLAMGVSLMVAGAAVLRRRRQIG